ncbi:hypothetical protein F4009_02925 [Candidatus Poribacteria bacterium]|nr:hypothetical protein [Candidatus Poribacteria bacterium]MYK92951.1 hypothetical protein [Candidatus Poribacteria bacterium]
MQWNQKKILVAIAALTILWLPLTHAEETETVLHWKNGDTLPGQLLESKSGKIHWSSPHFSDNLIVDINVLDSIVFPKQAVPVTEAFRVGTVSGDIWMADLIGSDNNTLLFSSERHGEFRVNREMIYTLESREHSNLLFDGSQLSAWKLPEQDNGNGGNGVVLFAKEQEAQPSWHSDRGGRPQTKIAKANIFHAFDWPKRFEIDLELASNARPPSFVFALGKNLYETVRLETWVNELVVVQGTLFEPVLTIQPDRRNFRLRITYHENTDSENTGVLKVLDLNGNVLLKLDGVKPTVEASGIYIYNRGQDLTVRRLRVYRQPTEITNRQIGAAKPRVYMMSGEIIPGKLFVEKNGSYVLDTDGTQRDIDLQQIDRVVQPGITLKTTTHPTTLTYIDGTVLRGQITQLNSDSIQLQTAFVDDPITCSLASASLLKFESTTKTQVPVEDYDKLFYESGSLRGHISFDSKDVANLRWKPVGASESVRLANARGTRVERALQRVSKQKPFDTAQFPHLLHLKNGEVIPCQVLSYDETSIGFQSPFISVQHIDSGHVKGIEFSGKKTRMRTENRNPITITGGKGKHRVILEDGRILNAVTRRAKDGNVEIIILSDKKEEQPKWVKVEGDFAVNDAVALKRGVELIFDPLETRSRKLDAKLERALTVPRFNRDDPPNHILVASNGDLKRGKLLGINGQTIQFDSKLRQFALPIDRVTRVVDVSDDSRQLQEVVGLSDPSSTENRKPKTDTYSHEIRVTLTDNPILIFEPLEVKEGKLFGRSSIYDKVSVPVDSIQYLHFGEKAKSFKSVYEEWVVRPAQEPAYEDKSSPSQNPRIRNR